MPCWHSGAITVSLSCPTEVGILLQSNKKVDEFRKVLTKVTTERKEKYNVLWADPKASPQVSSFHHVSPSSVPNMCVLSVMIMRALICIMLWGVWYGAVSKSD